MNALKHFGAAVMASTTEALHTPINVWITIAAFVTLSYAAIAVLLYARYLFSRRLAGEIPIKLDVSINESSTEIDKIWLTTNTRKDIDVSAYETVRLQGVDEKRKRARPLLVKVWPRNNPSPPSNPEAIPKGLQHNQIGMSSTLFSKLFPGQPVPDNTKNETPMKSFLIAKQKPQTGFDLYWNNIDPQTRFQNRLTLGLTTFGIFLSVVSVLPLALQFGQQLRLAEDIAPIATQSHSNFSPSLRRAPLNAALGLVGSESQSHR